jgi:hypothetical protein
MVRYDSEPEILGEATKALFHFVVFRTQDSVSLPIAMQVTLVCN